MGCLGAREGALQSDRSLVSSTEEGTAGVMTKRHEGARCSFQVVWEEGVTENARRVNRSQVMAIQKLTVTKGHLSPKSNWPFLHFLKTIT